MNEPISNAAELEEIAREAARRIVDSVLRKDVSWLKHHADARSDMERDFRAVITTALARVTENAEKELTTRARYLALMFAKEDADATEQNFDATVASYERPILAAIAESFSQRTGNVSTRKEQCVDCQQFVSDWVEAQEAPLGRICRPCETARVSTQKALPVDEVENPDSPRQRVQRAMQEQADIIAGLHRQLAVMKEALTEWKIAAAFVARQKFLGVPDGIDWAKLLQKTEAALSNNLPAAAEELLKDRERLDFLAQGDYTVEFLLRNYKGHDLRSAIDTARKETKKTRLDDSI